MARFGGNDAAVLGNSTVVGDPTPARLIGRTLSLAALLCCLAAVAAASAPGMTLEDRLEQNEGQQGAIRDKIEKSERKAEVLTTKISEFRSRIDELAGPIARLDARIAELERRISETTARIGELRAEQRALARRIARLEAELGVAEQRLVDRLVNAYVSGRPSFQEIIVPGGTFQEWIRRREVVGQIAETDREIHDSVERLRNAVRRERERNREVARKLEADLEQVRADEAQVQAERAELVRKQNELSAVKAKRERYLSRIQDHQQQMHEDLKQLEKDSAALEAAIQAGQAAVAPGTVPPGPGPSGLIWPVNGPVVSPFGPRWGRLHAGVDIAVPAGTPIYASAGGVVTHAGWMGGYGNLVIVQHGGNLATAYAHQSSIVAAVGQVVNGGDLLGYVGCTGHCYGDHLHFETRIGGAAVDPMQYF